MLTVTLLACAFTQTRDYSQSIQLVGIELHPILTLVRGSLAWLTSCCEMIALLDMLCSFAHVAAINQHYIRPTVTEDGELHIVNGYHPILHSVHHNQLVPNDVMASQHGYNLMVVTGPNGGGKSIYLSSVALLHVMAQIGCYIPATSARIRITDQLLTRATDAHAVENISCFQREMTDVAYILNNLNDRCLVLVGIDPVVCTHLLVLMLKLLFVCRFPQLDEVGRGTSSPEGIALAWAICEALLKHRQAYSYCATHYMELCDLPSLYPTAVANIHMTVDVDSNQQMWFRHRLAAGAFNADTHYGIYLAELAKMPATITQRAVRWSEALRRHTSVVATKVSCGKTRTQQDLLVRLIAMKHVPRTKQQTEEELESIMAEFSDLLAESTHHHRRHHYVAEPVASTATSSVCSVTEGDPVKVELVADSDDDAVQQLPPSQFQLLSPATHAVRDSDHRLMHNISPRSAPAGISFDDGSADRVGLIDWSKWRGERKYKV